MISQIKNSVFTRAFWGLMGFYFLNISVDSNDLNPQYIPEDLSINDQESIVEIVVEQVLGYEDAIKEYDDNDTEDHNNQSNVKIDIITQNSVDSNFYYLFTTSKEQKFLHYNACLVSGFQRLITPPPKL